VVWPVLDAADSRWPGPWVAVLTGNGMKSPGHTNLQANE
jgi:hypothetical protein